MNQNTDNLAQQASVLKTSDAVRAMIKRHKLNDIFLQSSVCLR